MVECGGVAYRSHSGTATEIACRCPLVGPSAFGGNADTAGCWQCYGAPGASSRECWRVLSWNGRSNSTPPPAPEYLSCSKTILSRFLCSTRLSYRDLRRESESNRRHQDYRTTLQVVAIHGKPLLRNTVTRTHPVNVENAPNALDCAVIEYGFRRSRTSGLPSRSRTCSVAAS